MIFVREVLRLVVVFRGVTSVCSHSMNPASTLVRQIGPSPVLRISAAQIAHGKATPVLGMSLVSSDSARASTVKVNATSAITKIETRSDQRPVVPAHSWFAFTFSLAFVVKCLCMMSNVMFQISPFTQVKQFAIKGDTGDMDPAPLLSILYGGCQWCFYGLFAYLVTNKTGFLVLVYSNILGAVLGVYYIFGFHRNCKNEKVFQKLRMYYQFVVSLVVAQICAMMSLQRERALFFCGLVSSAWSVIGAFSMLATLPVILETRCSGTINLPLLTVGALSAVLWLVCGIMLWDPWITVPNAMGLVISGFAFSLLWRFPKKLEEHSMVAASRRTSEHFAETFLQDSTFPAPEYGTMDIIAETGGTI